MQIVTLILAAVSATVAKAQCPTAAPPMPTCAMGCMASAASAIGCTAATDFACQCASATAFAPKASPCLINSCGPETALSISAMAQTMCSLCAPKPTA